MFPNPQDALPLPLRPNLERYKKLAKDLIKACKSVDPDAIGDWAEAWVKMLVRRSGIDLGRKESLAIRRWTEQIEAFAEHKLSTKDGPQCRLADAQFVIARSHGFESWPKFSKHLSELSQKSSVVAKFETAADAICNGDIKTLKRLLAEKPQLIHSRSTREHEATLLHYVSANGVEGYRQKTPKNIVEIAKILLNSGADVNAEADVYGGGATTLGLVATSVHPFRAGVQNPLMQILLDHGAEIDHETSAGNRQNAVTGCLANGRGEAAAFLADRGARLNLESAAGVGRLDVVKGFFNADGSLKEKTTRKQLQSAFNHACAWGRLNVVEFLLEKDVNLGGHHGDGQTPMHCAAITGQLETIKFLLKQDAPLEAKNIYGGTVLGQTLWSAAHGGDPKVYAEIIKLLIAAGARVPERHVPVNKPIDDLLRGYGSVPEPTWYWFGEKPRRTRD
ncbi:MAG TPA: ankyrin repeat domain-containing protein [Pyrinomonadaceae bacterium]|jgi:ankyrin repeat protein|nr:ankyrin repeat domain-containing protein [Pyrinomonadaceae bacterium]